ncbi:hypothetical protein [Crocinitomix algicola]|uniref:hypothetical protein n=1 Tax=Crocinitomix algicola TaxID=1740263 RepID=UPI000872151D|nr:hypothetical protein [Crocinitomix algicola]
MNRFFTLIYIVPNRFSEERIAVALLANLDGIPYFMYSEKKLNFAMNSFSAPLKAAVKKGFKYMDLDVNRINRGEEALSLFDQPFSKKLLKELTRKKRGVIQYSNLIEVGENKNNIKAEQLFKKFIGVDYVEKVTVKNSNFKTRFKEFVSDRKFNDFTYNFKLEANNYPFIYKDMRVDLCRITGFYTVFYTLDFSKSLQTIQVHISRFRMIVQSLQQKSSDLGLSSGRYYLVYESTASKSQQDLIQTIRKEKQAGFEIIRMSEMKDKI